MANWERTMVIGAAAAASMGVQSASAQAALIIETELVRYAEPADVDDRKSVPVDRETLRGAVEKSNIPAEYFDEDLDDV